MHLYLFSEDPIDVTIEKIKDIITAIVGKHNNIRYSKEKEWINVLCKFFIVYIHFIPVSETQFIFMKEDYLVDTNVYIEFVIYGKTYDIGMDYVAKIVKEIMKEFYQDVLIFDECTKTVLKRSARKDKIEIDPLYWESRLDDMDIDPIL